MIKGKNKIEDYGIFSPQDFLATREGIKPVARQGIDGEKNDTIELFKSFCEKNGMYYFVGDIENFYGTKHTARIMYVSKSLNKCKDAYSMEVKGDRAGLGKLLGYPSCCAEFFVNNLKSITYDFSWVRCVFLNSNKNVSKKAFFTNFLFNSNGKAFFPENSIQNKKLLEKISANPLFFLIPHIPCSFDCEKSIEMGKKIFSILKKEHPDFTNSIVNILKKPVLIFNDFNWVIFDGKFNTRNNTINYSSICDLSFCFGDFEKSLDKIKKGNSLKAVKERINIFKDNKLIYSLEKKNKLEGILLNFS